MKGKLIVSTMLILIMAFSLCSCDKGQSVTNEKGELLVYEGVSSLEESGFYVHNRNDDTFSPVMGGVYDYAGIPNLESGWDITEISQNAGLEIGNERGRFVWVSDSDFDPISLIPKVDGKNTELILYQKEEDEMPEQYVLEKYKNLGYTMGAHFTFGETGNTLFVNTEEMCKGSNAASELSDASDGLLKLNKINNEKALLEKAKKNVDTDIEILTGLEKDSKYQLGYFDGTIYNSVEIIADTLCFKSEKAMQLVSPLRETEQGYFRIKLPKNTKSGYYYINDNGLFRFEQSE